MLITGQNSTAFFTTLSPPYLALTESQSNTNLASCFLCFWILGISTWKEKQTTEINLDILAEFFKEQLPLYKSFLLGTNFLYFPKWVYTKATD